MATRKSVAMKDQIQKMRAGGMSVRKIAQALKIHRSTVRRYVDTTDPSYSAPEVEAPAASWEAEMCWEKVAEEIRRGVPVKTLWHESEVKIGYAGFWKACRKHVPCVPEAAIKLHHVPGERAFFDYCDGLPVADGCHTRSTHLFVGVLPFSAYAFAEFVFDQKLPSFLRSQENFFATIGGVVPYVVVDNLKSGVTKAHRYDPDVNRTYCDFAHHYGFVVLPARPHESRDKAAVEALIGVIQRSIFPRMRNKLLPLLQLNGELKEYLHELNAQVMKDHGISRHERFEVERPTLLPLPATRFELSEWRNASVHPDCHIQVMKNFYSVPFAFVGKTVRVRVTAKLVEVFDHDGTTVAVHERLHTEHRYSTDQRHYPEAKVATAFFDVHQAKLQAARIGPQTEALVDKLLSGTHPLKYLRRCQGIVRLVQRHHVMRASLEHAAAIALQTNNLRFDFIKAAALHAPRTPPSVSSTRVPQRLAGTTFLHDHHQAPEVPT